jgi:hypothetical protein
MAKIVVLSNVKLIEENEVSKHFKDEIRGIDCFVSKAFDEETQKHCLVASIEKIPELNAMHIQYPFVFDIEEERDTLFKEFDCKLYLDWLIETMTNQIEDAKKNAESQPAIEEMNAIMEDGGIQLITEEEADKLDLPELREHTEKPE